MPIQECFTNIITAVSNLIKLNQYNFPAMAKSLPLLKLTLFCTFLLPKKVLLGLVFGLGFFSFQRNPNPQKCGLSQNQNKLTTLHKVY